MISSTESISLFLFIFNILLFFFLNDLQIFFISISCAFTLPLSLFISSLNSKKCVADCRSSISNKITHLTKSTKIPPTKITSPINGTILEIDDAVNTTELMTFIIDNFVVVFVVSKSFFFQEFIFLWFFFNSLSIHFLLVISNLNDLNFLFHSQHSRNRLP